MTTAWWLHKLQLERPALRWETEGSRLGIRVEKRIESDNGLLKSRLFSQSLAPLSLSEVKGLAAIISRSKGAIAEWERGRRKSSWSAALTLSVEYSISPYNHGHCRTSVGGLAAARSLSEHI